MKRALVEALTPEETKFLSEELVQQLTKIIQDNIFRTSGFLDVLTNPLIKNATFVQGNVSTTNVETFQPRFAGKIFAHKMRLEEILATFEKSNHFNNYLKDVYLTHEPRATPDVIWDILFNGENLLEEHFEIYARFLTVIIERWEKAGQSKKVNTVDYNSAFLLLTQFMDTHYPDTYQKKYNVEKFLHRHKNFYDKVVQRSKSFLEMAIASPDTPTEVIQIINNMSYPDIRGKWCQTCKKQATGVDSKSGKMFCGTKCQRAFYDMED